MMQLRKFDMSGRQCSEFRQKGHVLRWYQHTNSDSGLGLTFPSCAFCFLRGSKANGYFQNSHHFLGGSDCLKTGKSSGRTAFIG